MGAPAAILALVLLAPAALAHVDSFSQSATLQAGPFLVFFEPRPTPPFANATVTMVAQVSLASTGSLVTNVVATALVGGPGVSERKALQPDGSGYLVASLFLPEPGSHSARILIRNASSNETFSADTEFEVFPDLPVRIRPMDVAQDVYVGELTPLAFEVVDPDTLERTGRLADLKVRVEHWSEDHKRSLGAEEATPRQTSPGVWRIDHRFAERGMYHLRFASDAGGFNYSEVPLLHVYAVNAPPAATDDPAKAPGPAVALVVGAVAALALVRRR